MTTEEFTSFVEDLKLGDELAPDRVAEQGRAMLKLTSVVLSLSTDPDDIMPMLEAIYKAGVRAGQITMQQSTLAFVQRLMDLDNDEIKELVGGEDS